MHTVGPLSISHWIISGLAYGLPLVLVFGLAGWRIAQDIHRSRSGAQPYRSLRAMTPLLTLFILVSAIGAPFLGRLDDHDWPSEIFFSALLMSARASVLICLYGALGTTLVFFHRALSNINYFAGKRLCTPNDVVLALLPGTNLIFMPLVWYDAHYHSRRLLLGPRASKTSSGALAVAAFGLLLTAVLLEVLALVRNEIDPSLQDGLSRSVMSFCAATAGAMLFARIIMEIRHAQEAIAADWSGNRPPKTLTGGQQGRLEVLRLFAVVSLIAVGVATAIAPDIVVGRITLVRGDAAGPNQMPQPSASGQRLQAVADRMNKSGRTQLDQVTWLEGAKVEHGVFVYEYTVAVNKLANTEVLSFLQKVQPNIIRGYCTDPSLSVFRELKTTLVVRYMYADRAPLGQINVSLGDCPR